MIRLMVVDDHELVRLGMRHILDDYPSIKIVGEAGDGETADIIRHQPLFLLKSLTLSAA